MSWVVSALEDLEGEPEHLLGLGGADVLLLAE